jgi:integrase
MRLRIISINWHPRYKYCIGGLRVNGKRKRLFFVTEPEAEKELRNLQIKAKRQGQAGLNMSDSLRAMAVDCARQLKPHGKTILDATSFYLHHLAATKSARIEKLIEDYLRSQERSQLSARHLADIRSRLGRFQEAFGERPVRTLNAVDIEDWLYGLSNNGNGLEPQTLINWRATLHAFFGWLLHQKLVDFNPVAGVAKPKVVRTPPAIWTPDDLRRFLAAAPAELIPILTIGSFAGLRTAELLRLDWSEINLERALIEVRADKAKSARRRLVKVEPNLAAWLIPHGGKSGKIWPKGWRSYHEATAKLCRELELEWPENGLRHSYASYHLAHFQSAEMLALQMGHTSARILWHQVAFIPPLLPLETAAGRITGKRYKAQAMAALEKFMPPWMLEEVRKRGELSADFCAQAKEDYQTWRFEPVREKQRQVGKKTKNLKRGTKKQKILLDTEWLQRVALNSPSVCSVAR